MDYILNITSFIAKGAVITLELYIITFIFSIPLGAICALGKISKFKILNILISGYTWFFRGTPLLLQLFFVYYGLPIIGITLKPLTAASIAFILNYGAYLTEIFRAGIQSIDKGQYEAAKVIGMNYTQTMTRIILPQTMKRILPPVCNEAVTLIKDTALVAAIGMGDLLRASKEVVTRDFNIIPFAIAFILYLVITSFIVAIFKNIEKKYSIYE